MLVVLAILGMVGAVVLVRGPGRSAALDLRTASTTVVGALRLARSRAIATDRPTLVRFDAGRATLQVGADPARALPAGIGMAIVTARDAATGDGDRTPTIRFLPDGSSTGGRVELTGQGRTARVGVDWLTGRVSLAADS